MKQLRYLRSFIAALALLAVASCSTDQSPLAPSAPPAQTGQLDPSLVGGLLSRLHLLQCTPLPYDSESEWVGPMGGVIAVGPHRLVVPAGALDRWVRITAEVISDDVNSIRFSPEGLEFDRSASLTMSYANCNVLGILLPKQIVYTSEGLNILELIPSLDNVFQKKTTGRIDHFSRYAVGW